MNIYPALPVTWRTVTDSGQVGPGTAYPVGMSFVEAVLFYWAAAGVKMSASYSITAPGYGWSGSFTDLGESGAPWPWQTARRYDRTSEPVVLLSSNSVPATLPLQALQTYWQDMSATDYEPGDPRNIVRTVTKSAYRYKAGTWPEAQLPYNEAMCRVDIFGPWQGVGVDIDSEPTRYRFSANDGWQMYKDGETYYPYIEILMFLGGDGIELDPGPPIVWSDPVFGVVKSMPDDDWAGYEFAGTSSIFGHSVPMYRPTGVGSDASGSVTLTAETAYVWPGI